MPRKINDYTEAQAMRDKGFSIKIIAKKLQMDAGTIGKRTTAKKTPIITNKAFFEAKRKEEIKDKYRRAQAMRDKGLSASAVAKELGISIASVKANTRVFLGDSTVKTVTKKAEKVFETRQTDLTKTRSIFVPALRGHVFLRPGDTRTDEQVRRFWQEKKDNENKRLTIKKTH